MKSVTKIALSIALVAITVLSIVVATLAWFTSNPDVDADNVTMNAARTLTVTFDADIDDEVAAHNKGYRYDLQTGKGAPGDPDAPYVYEAGSFTVTVHPSAADKGGKVKIEFGTVKIEYGRHPSSYTSGEISDVTLSDLFTTMANCYEKSNTPDPTDGDDNFVRVNGLYIKDDGTHTADQHYKKTSYVIDSDGFVKDAAGGDYIIFPEGEYGFSFTFIFLPETAYALWTEARSNPIYYDAIYGYRDNPNGDYIGIYDYVPYEAKYHSSRQRYSVTNDGNGTGTLSASGDYVRAVTVYKLAGEIDKYVRSGDVYTLNNETGTYVRVGDSDDYVLYDSLPRFDRVEGFPYSEPMYLDATYTFTVTCSVEEAEVE